MNKEFGQNNPEVVDYVLDLFNPEDAVLKEVRERSDEHGLPQIQVGKMDSLHLEVLVSATGAKKAVEIGTLAGYSGISILRGMGEGGKLYTFEFDPKHAEVALDSFEKAGFRQNVELFVGPALENLNKIEAHGPFDLVFIDADKLSYPEYFDWAAKNLKVGGVILGDNTFAWGEIANTNFENKRTEDLTKALREFNAKAASNTKFRSTILPTAEGLTMSVKIKD